MIESNFHCERLTLIGVGLIGGSLAGCLKKTGAVEEVVGVARTESTLDKALEMGVIDRKETDMEMAVRGSDVVVIATPMQVMPGVLSMLEKCLHEETVVTDVGSVKSHVVAAAQQCLDGKVGQFVPGHPIAGREHSGVEASNPDLFRGKTVILTPLHNTHVGAVQTVTRMWRQVGADVQTLDADVHDRLLAATSHLPHIVAYALVDYLAGHQDSDLLFELAASGFYDFTRIASSDPVMWRDICVTNRDAIVDVLRGYRANIDQLLAAIEARDETALYACFDRSKRSRDSGLHNKSNSRKQQ